MPKILVTPDFLKSKATELTNAQTALTATMKAIQQLADTLLSEWEGKAQKAFMNSYEAKKQVYKEFDVALQKFADFLNDYASTMDTADTGGASEAGGLA
ncbi:MAG: WXG100 family type VII secretion target [Synergistaceae bacterium]|nr:WXG100 family type VII secretion target [Synergistaceae bacterium]MBR1603408.1 WXG100 family type VII secretion target [Synergistaceae bacterium]